MGWALEHLAGIRVLPLWLRVLGGWVLCAACAGGADSRPPAASAAQTPPPGTAPSEGPAESIAAATAPPTKPSISGLRGTLNHDDVVQAMEARQPALIECIQTGQRSMNFVGGDIHFEFKVDAEGKPVDVRATRCDIGHGELEACLTNVLAETSFPAPAGRTITKDLSWEMAVDSAYRPADPLPADTAATAMLVGAESVYEGCEIAHGHRYSVTTYINKRGRARTSGAVVSKGGAKARAHVPCVLERVKQWRFPKAKRNSKITYELRYQKAPTEKELRAKAKREAKQRKKDADRRKREAKRRRRKRH